MNPNGMTIQTKATEQCFPLVLFTFIMRHEVIHTISILGTDIFYCFTRGTLSR